MIGKSPIRNTPELFRPMLESFIDESHELVLQAKKIDWQYFEDEFRPLYSERGRAAKPIRLMVGCLLLKQMYNLGDETITREWVMNPYMQYFCGEVFFQHKFPFDPSDSVHFRKRLGEDGVRKIFQHSVRLCGKDAEENLVVSDTTVQGNNTEFSTDARLYLQIINKCNSIAEKEGIRQRQRYTKVSKNLMRETYNGNHAKRKKVARAATRKLGSIADRQVREQERKLNTNLIGQYAGTLAVLNRALLRDRNPKDKVYSIHKQHTACIVNGKADHMYEFGNKMGLISTANTQINFAISAFPGNPNDSTTMDPLLEQMREGGLKLLERLAYDRRGRGLKELLGVGIITPGKASSSDPPFERAKKRKPFRRRAAIEPLIGHLKSDNRMERNYLWKEVSSTLNAMLSATAWNLQKLMKKLKKEFLYALLCLKVFPMSLFLFFGCPQPTRKTRFITLPLV